ncbi:aldose 1-epimerase family protein [Tsukamurella sp. 8F]|uniref:aldose 1-epimerase family protein n=1 Tax=unclassified Tsukamurella TaxID=2633480 RepID=UPI0023B9D8C8|nr:MULTISPECIES: aldose 1-epimerase family protein [unclassified Tsukamurella]MDF0529813.1 aldose 1-epimerase family protein [Tsukamurella sp. 8J]MDF0587005.1 aldose 1-epimerase family protein [Tsukamurella sp. 8F]
MTVQPGFTITSGGYSAQIARTGAGLRGLRRDDVPLTEEWPLGVKPPLSAGLILAPWPNRTEDGFYSFGGAEHHLEITEPDLHNANHGFVRRVDWSDVEIEQDAVTLAVDVGRHPGWPYDLHLRVRYSVSGDGLVVEFTAENQGDSALPFALGFHTFLRVGDAPVDDCTLELGAGLVQPLDARKLPDGPPVTVEGTDYDFRAARALAGRQLDTPFTQTGNRYVLRGPDARTELWTGPELSWVQVFVADPANGQGFPGRAPGGGEDRAVAVEPMTSPPNALHTGVDVITIAPGARWSTRWGIR